MESTTSGRRGISFLSILLNSLWTTLMGILFFRLATTNGHKLSFIHFFSISGTLLMTLPWIIQLLISSTVIILHKTKGYNLMWIVQSPTVSKEFVDHTKGATCSVSSSPSSTPQVLKESNAEEIAIRIVIGAADDKRVCLSAAAPSGMHMDIEGRHKPKLLTNGST